MVLLYMGYIGMCGPKVYGFGNDLSRAGLQGFLPGVFELKLTRH